MDCPLKQKICKFKWVDKKVDYVEWVYGLHEILNQNGEKVSLDTLFENFNPIFGFKSFQHSSCFSITKIRSKERIWIFQKQEKLLKDRKEKAFK